jgi:tetratricopeptide (TPR) repeat protein
MTVAPSPSLYNQTLLGDDDFVANFVARHDVLDAILRRLRAIEPDDSGLHHILIGPRGMGKTSLLRRVGIAINRDPELAPRYIPLGFREEQYNVLTLGNFWRNCGESLAEWAEATGLDDLAAHLDAVLPTQAWASDEGSVEQFNAQLAKLGRRAVLLVDNIDLILNALSDHDQWTLRRHLQARDGPIVIGAATHPLKQSADRQAAFHEFFQPYYLDPLAEQETERCMRALAQRRGENGRHVLQVLDQQPERLKTLHTLTGGNPRILALIYRLLESADSEAAMADLEILLDQVTPYYKARIEEYQTAQQRAVIDAIALHWDPITTADLSRATNILTTTLSPLLIKLRKDGLIEETPTSGTYSGHQLVERFLNIWYLMRHGARRTRQKMRWLVAFLTSFYSKGDLVEIDQIAKVKNYKDNWSPLYALAFNEALSYQKTAKNDLLFMDTEVIEFPTTKEYGNNAVDTVSLPTQNDFAGALQKITQMCRSNDGVGARAALDEMIRCSDDPAGSDLREQLAMALVDGGSRLALAGDSAAAVIAFDIVVAQFRDFSETPQREQVAMALFNKGVALGQMGDSAAAIAAYDGVLARFADAEAPALRERVAKALVNKGVALGQMGDSAAEIAAYDEVLARFADAEEPALREQVAMALFNKGVALGQMGDRAAEIAAYDEVLARFADAEAPALRERVAKALFNKGFALRQMGDSAAEIAAYDGVLARFADAEAPALREQVAMALFNKGVTFRQMGDSAAAIAAYDGVLARFADAEPPALREQVAMALVNKGFALGHMGDSAAEIACYEKLLELAVEEHPESLDYIVAYASIRVANALLEADHESDRAEALYISAAAIETLWANANLAWLYLWKGRIAEAKALRQSLAELPAQGLSLLDAALELVQDNVGSATGHLAAALQGDLHKGSMDFTDDLDRLLRLAEKRGYGERLVTWFEETNVAERLAPVYAAFRAYVRGERSLLDVNPEVRRPAQIIYDRLDAPRRNKPPIGKREAKGKSGRGRPRKT